MKVSIITPCYNSARYVGKTIQSVLSQTFLNWEYIIIDDGSTDNPELEVTPYLKDPRIRFVRQKNGGVSNARNNGYALSSKDSSYIYFLDADDVLYPTMLEVLTAYMDKNPEVGLVYCKPDVINKEGEVIPNWIESSWTPRFVATRWGVRTLPASQPETPFCSLYAQTTIIPSLSLIRRSVYQQTKGFDEEFGQHNEDLDVFLQIALKSQVHYLNVTLVQYRRHDAQSTSNPDRIHKQGIKLLNKWVGICRKSSGVEKEKIAYAHRFYTLRVISVTGLPTGLLILKEKNIFKGLRFIFGALRRYILSLFLVRPYDRTV